MVKIHLLSNTIESNGKPNWFNNAQEMHAIPLGTPILFNHKTWYVASHDRDCDMTPLYRISRSWQHVRYASDTIREIASSVYKDRTGEFPNTIDKLSIAFEMIDGWFETGIPASEIQLLNPSIQDVVW